MRFESLDKSKCEGSSGSLRSEALMGYMLGDHCWATVRGCSLRSVALMGYLCGGRCWVTVRSGSLRSKALNGDLCGRLCWVTVRGGSLRSRALEGYLCGDQVWVAVGGGSRVLALILLVFVHHYYRVRRLGYCVYSPSNPPEPPLLLYNTPGHTPVHSLGAW